MPHAENGLSFVDFRPWETISVPIVWPSNIGSFWTLLYSRIWFDMEPRFLYFGDTENALWQSYFRWMAGQDPSPSEIPLSPFRSFMGSTLIALGLIPLLFLIAGLFRSISKAVSSWRQSTLPYFETQMLLFWVLLIFNLFGVVALAHKYPCYSTVKGLYLLNSLPAIAVFFALGVSWLEEYRTASTFLVSFMILLFILIGIHFLDIVISSF